MVKYKYWVSYFCELNISTGGLGLDMRGHIKTSSYEMTRPLTTSEEVHNFIEFLTKQENKDTKSGNMWRIHLLGFSLMYIDQGA